MSSLIIRVRTKLFQKTAKGVMDYIRGHLQILLEGGGFLQLPNYVDQQGRVVPILLHPSLWEAAGLKVGSQILNSALVENLCKGMNSHGRQLTPTILFKVPVETLLTLPCELSEALREDPEAAQRILLAAAEAYLEWLDLFAVRVRIGKNKKVTARALTLSVCFLHALNRANEAHYHLHILTFGPALDGDANWRTHNIYSCLRHFHHPDGVRDSVTLAVVAAAAKEGYQVLITLGKVSNGVGIGATVNCPDGRVIHARSVARFRSAQILCNRELKCELGVPPLTERELELVSEYVSNGLWNIPEKKCNAKLREKLVVLGLLGPKQGQQPNLNLALKRMDQAMAVIHLWGMS